MKFNVVIGNPPYQVKRGNSTITIYQKFYNKGTELLSKEGVLALITPSAMLRGLLTGITLGRRRVIQRRILSLSYDKRIKDTYFRDVGSTFCYFVVANEAYNTTQQYQISANKFGTITPFLPNDQSDICLSIIDKCFLYGLNQLNGVWNAIGSKAITDPTGTITVLKKIKSDGSIETYTISYNGDHKLFNTPKLFIAGFGNAAYVATDHNLVSANEKLVYTIATESDSVSRNIYNMLDCNLQKYLSRTISARGPYIDFIKHLRPIDFTKSWNNEELYAYFKLTQEEIDHIENGI